MMTSLQQFIIAIKDVKFYSIDFKQYLQKEKKIIKNAYNQGYKDALKDICVIDNVNDVSKRTNAENYYVENFKLKQQ